jgi:hypothetical protein
LALVGSAARCGRSANRAVIAGAFGAPVVRRPSVAAISRQALARPVSGSRAARCPEGCPAPSRSGCPSAYASARAGRRRSGGRRRTCSAFVPQGASCCFRVKAIALDAPFPRTPGVRAKQSRGNRGDNERVSWVLSSHVVGSPLIQAPDYAIAASSCWHACSQRRHSSAQTLQCSIPCAAWISHSSPQLRHVAMHARSTALVTFAS